jgi:hypothetical protein
MEVGYDVGEVARKADGARVTNVMRSVGEIPEMRVGALSTQADTWLMIVTGTVGIDNVRGDVSELKA